MRAQGDALSSLFLMGPVFSLSRWRRRLEEGQGGPASPKGLLVTGRGSRRVPRPQRSGQTDPQRALRDRVRTELQRCSDSPAGLSLYRSLTSSVPPPHPSPKQTLIHTSCPSITKLCGPPIPSPCPAAGLLLSSIHRVSSRDREGHCWAGPPHWVWSQTPRPSSPFTPGSVSGVAALDSCSRFPFNR